MAREIVSGIQKKIGRPATGQAMTTIGIRFQQADIAAFAAYAAQKGLKSPGEAVRALGLEGLHRVGLRPEPTSEAPYGQRYRG